MKLVTCEYEGKIYVGRISDCGEWVNVQPFDTMIDMIKGNTKETLATMPYTEEWLELKDVKLLAPILKPIHDVICLGVNYADHAAESNRAVVGQEKQLTTDNATYFSKRVVKACGPDDVIDGNLEVDDHLDYEVELAVIIGKEGKDIKAEDAYDYIAGYTILNDVSARQMQTTHNQWYIGKSADTHTPMGPWIVTEDEFSRPIEVEVESRVNGEVRQHSNTKMLIHSIPEIIAEISSVTTLEPGDIISTGTPAGVAMGMNPPVWLKSGDVVELEIQGIGVLKNTIR